MDKVRAYNAFLSSFNIPAIDEQSVYDTPILEQLGFPNMYITYEFAVGELDAPVTLSIDLWHKSTSWREIEAKAAEIAQAIGNGGKKVHYDGGSIWITRSTPVYQRMDAANEDYRRIHFNINAEYLSA